MVGTHDVFFGSERIGQVNVTRQGLYYHFSCRCRLSGAVVCKLVAQIGDHAEDLGILVPEGSGFSLETNVSVKRFLGGSVSFQVIPRHPRLEGKFVPLSPEAPFPYIQRLERAFLDVRDGQVGVILPASDT